MKHNMKQLFHRALCLVDVAVVFFAYLFVDFLLTNHAANEEVTFLGGLSYQLNIRFLAVFIAAAVNVGMQWLFGGYHVLWRVSGINDYTVCVSAGAVSMIGLLCGSVLIRNPIFFYPWDVQLLVCPVYIFGFVAVRFAVRTIIKSYKLRKESSRDEKGIKLLIVGAGGGGVRIISEVLAGSTSYKIVGLIDDDLEKQKMQIRGFRVLGTRRDIPRVCDKYGVEEVLLAIPTLDHKNRSEILQIIQSTGRKVRILPSLHEIVNREKFTSGIRDVQIDDLLPRDSIKLDNQKISEYLNGKTVLVTGGGGSIGSELCRQILKFSPKKLYILDIYENNAYDLQMDLQRKMPGRPFEVIIASVRDGKRIDEIFESLRPEVVFHAAAHKHVPLMEHDPAEAIKNNVMGTYNVATAADKYGVLRFVLVSTDKAVNPTNVMGATKRVCEMIIQSINARSKTEYVAVRFGNVLGSNGSVVPLFKKQIAERSPITLTHKEITRFFMTIPEAVSLILEAASYARGGEIFILDMGQPVKIYDLAVKLIELSGFEVGTDIPIIITGLRPGEKLYEELLMNEEGLRATSNEKIFVAQPMTLDWDSLCIQLAALEAIAKDGASEEIKYKLAEVVPTYKSKPAEPHADATISETEAENPEAGTKIYS